jgi:hypothetical protein
VQLLVAGAPLRACTTIALPDLHAHALPQAQASPRRRRAAPQSAQRSSAVRAQKHSKQQMQPSVSPAIGPTPGFARLRQHPACQGVCHRWAGLLLDQGLCSYSYSTQHQHPARARLCVPASVRLSVVWPSAVRIFSPGLVLSYVVYIDIESSPGPRPPVGGPLSSVTRIRHVTCHVCAVLHKAQTRALLATTSY